MKSFLVTLASWAILYFGIEYVFRQRFYPPGDWIGALLVSFFMALGIGALRKARIDAGDAELIARPEGPPRDGKREAISGTIQPIGAVLIAPFSGFECVAYDYEVSHYNETGKTRNVVLDRAGFALAPSVIISG